MLTLNTHDAQANLPGSLGQIATYSRVGDDFRPDVVELQDGRIIKIHQATTASAERNCFAVSVIHAGYSSANPMGAGARVLGGCGLMYRHRPSGAWELHPRERAVDRLQRGSAERHGIAASEHATARAAALQLLTLSDGLTRTCLDYVGDNQGHKIGRWRVKLLAKHADGWCTGRPEPASVHVAPEGAQFLITRATGERCRIAVTPWTVGGWRQLETSHLAIKQPAGDAYPVPVVPGSVVKHCLSRCF